MLNQIKISKSASVSSSADGAIDMLLGCHERIRHFSAVALKLAHAQCASPADIVEAAEGLHRYFAVSLPLHEADENESLDPRLRKAAPDGDSVVRACNTMREEHEHIDEVVDRIVPLWMLVKNNPEKLDEFAGEMCQLAGRLKELFDRHLQLEEETIFPALRRLLSEEELRAMAQEMKARRQ